MRAPAPGELYKHHLDRLAWMDDMVADHGLRRALCAADLDAAHQAGQPAIVADVEGLDFFCDHTASRARVAIGGFETPAGSGRAEPVEQYVDSRAGERRHAWRQSMEADCVGHRGSDPRMGEGRRPALSLLRPPAGYLRLDSERQIHESRDNALVKIHSMFDKHCAKGLITPPKIGVRQIHRVN